MKSIFIRSYYRNYSNIIIRRIRRKIRNNRRIKAEALSGAIISYLSRTNTEFGGIDLSRDIIVFGEIIDIRLGLIEDGRLGLIEDGRLG